MIFDSYYDTVSCNYMNFYAAAQGLPVSDSALCDGYAFGHAYGGTPPYTYAYSSGSADSTESALCPGVYQFTVTDATSQSYTSSFVVGYPGSVFISDPDATNYIDTLYSDALANCNFDYNIPVDTFYIDTTYYFMPNVETVVWVIYQDTNVFELTENYYYDTAGYYYFGLSVYCESRSSTFNSFTFYDDFYLAAHPVSTVSAHDKNEKQNRIDITPNPANDKVKVTINCNIHTGTNRIAVYSITGQKVIEKLFDENQFIIDTEALVNGIYTLIINGKMKKLIVSH